MSDFPLTLADLGVVIILLISAVLAFARGFVHEVLGLAAWVGAALAVLFGLDHVRPLFRQFISLPLLADIAAGGTLFIVTLLVLSLLTRSISNRVQDSPLNAVDRSLGFLFGLVRGALLVCIAYIPVAWLLPPPEQPAWLKDARSYPLIERGADTLKTMIAARSPAAETQSLDPGQERARKALETERMVREIISPDPKSASQPSNSTAGSYGQRERRELERLLDSDR